jgi:hypothetical protein
MRRLATAVLLTAALAAACGAGDEGAVPAKRAEPASASAEATPGPTEAQIAVRERLLEEIRSGKYRCYCTAAERARDRIARGLVPARAHDELDSALP